MVECSEYLQFRFVLLEALYDELLEQDGFGVVVGDFFADDEIAPAIHLGNFRDLRFESLDSDPS